MLFLGVTCLESDFEMKDNIKTLSYKAFNDNLGFEFKYFAQEIYSAL